MDAIHALTNVDLAALAAGLRTGRLGSPYSAMAVQRFCPQSRATLISADLELLASQGMTSPQIAIVLDSIVQARRSQHRAEEVVELVWSGPEAVGVSNRDTGVVLRELFGSAEREVLVCGFAVHQGKRVFKRLAERMTEIPQLAVRFFLDVRRQHKDTSLSVDLIRLFLKRFREKDWPGERMPELFHDPRSLRDDDQKRSVLHAKCVVVDRETAFVTSANFTEAAQERNIEVGVRVKSPVFADRLALHFDALVRSSDLRPLWG